MDRPISPTSEVPKQNDGVDIDKLTPQELKIYRLYGKLPKTNEILNRKLKDRKYFDSGDYAMNKEKAPPLSAFISNPYSRNYAGGSSTSDANNLPLPDVEKIMDLQKKKSITRHGSIISTTNKEISGINSKSNLETEIDINES